jgi:hypothetical protein
MPQKIDTDAILTHTYPVVEKAIASNKSKWLQMMSRFINKRSTSLFDIAPCDRIYYNDMDRDDFYKSLGILSSQIMYGIRETFYWPQSSFNPSQAKDDITIASLCIIRYFLLHNMQKELELAMIYLSFSGKFYPSIHYGFFKTVAPSKYRHVMEYVVNTKLTNKYDLKREGSVIGAIKCVNNTWIKSYNKQIRSFDDEDICYVIQQIHSRIKSFMKNIASLYYEAYKNKEYISYDKDNLPEEGDSSLYHLSSNDTFKLNAFVERTMERINTSQIDYSICRSCADSNVKIDEVRNILEAIMGDTENIKIIKELITLMIASYLEESEVKEVNSLKFLNFCLRSKPNSKDVSANRIKEIIEELLDSNSVQYRKRKHRNATKQSYHNAITIYFAYSIIRANQ